MKEDLDKKLKIDKVQFIVNYMVIQEFKALDDILKPHYVPSLNSLRYEFDPFHKAISKMKIEEDDI